MQDFDLPQPSPNPQKPPQNIKKPAKNLPTNLPKSPEKPPKHIPKTSPTTVDYCTLMALRLSGTRFFSALETIPILMEHTEQQASRKYTGHK